ncbi:MAG: hypothetical protein JW841_00100 [Deltaproteobacteria bacterium]|nr:hypothetical protein [Deltaproteobacteria bacterium]
MKRKIDNYNHTRIIVFCQIIIIISIYVGCKNNNTACSAGQLNCVCNTNNSCNDDNLICRGGYCILDICLQKNRGCTCDDGKCEAGLICRNNICQNRKGSLLKITNKQVRACEVLIEKNNYQIESIKFDNTIRGQMRNDDLYMALAFANINDAPLTNDIAQVYNADGEVVDLYGVTIKARCFDRLGAEVSNPELRFE